jgi:predicted GNAT family acetyltransferase
MPACHAGGRGFESRPFRKKPRFIGAFFVFSLWFNVVHLSDFIYFSRGSTHRFKIINMDILIQNQETETKGSFYYEVEGKRLAEMTYSKAGLGMIIIDHTDVDDSLRGKGVGLELVKYAVEFIRNKKIKMLPLCPFAKATILKHPEWKDAW